MPETTKAPTTAEKNEAPVQFDPKLFVNRSDIIRNIEKKVEALRNGEPVRRRTIRISGERGVGKTWLLLKLHRDILKKSLSIFVDFDVNSQEKQTLKEMEFRVESLDTIGFLEFLKTLSQELGGVPVPTETSIQEQSYWVVEKLTEYARQQVIVLLLDGLFTAPPKFVDLLEDYLLAPIISLDRTLVILTGRGKAPLFSNYYLRNEAEDRCLEAFAKTTIKNGKSNEGVGENNKEGLDELFTRLKGNSSYKSIGERGLRYLDEIYRISGGYPRTALLLARSEDLSQGVEQALDELLSFIEQKKRTKVRHYLEALSLLNRWHPDLEKALNERLEKADGDLQEKAKIYLDGKSLPYIEWGVRDPDAVMLLNAHNFWNDPSTKATLTMEELKVRYERFRQEGLRAYNKPAFWRVRNQLQDDQLLRWETKTISWRDEERVYNGYFMEEAIRYPLAYHLRVNKPGLWQWLHYVAYRLFDEWTEKYGREKYGPLALAHYAAVLEVAQGTTQESSPEHDDLLVDKQL